MYSINHLQPTHKMDISRLILLLAAVVTGSGADAFKFMSNWQPPKVLTESEKAKAARTEERFGDKSESMY